MDFVPECFLFGLSVTIIGPPLLQPRVFCRQIGVIVAQHNVVKDLAHNGTHSRARATVFKDYGDSNPGLS